MRYFARLLVALVLLAAPAAAQNVKRVYLTSGTTWAVPQDWNSQSNTVEIIGRGGLAQIDPGAGIQDKGGGGGGYSKTTNVVLAPGSTATVNFDATAGGFVWFATSTTVKAQNGYDGYSTLFQGQGGQASAGVGSVKYTGGSGGIGNGGGTDAGGGGGAAGPNGDGQSGSGLSGNAGGRGGNGIGGLGGVGGSPGGGNGGNGTEWDATHGSGGGGGGSTVNTNNVGNGGNYGGGSAKYSGGTRSPGLIVITYAPRHRVSTSVF